MKTIVHPLTRDRWGDLVELFNRPGGSIVRGCWCMHYRQTGPPPPGNRGARNRRAMQSLVDEGRVPGLLAYRDGRPVGWVSLGPREDFLRLQGSPIMKPVDDKPVWSIVCFYVDAGARGQGVSEELLSAAVDYARSEGVRLVEAYPVDQKGRIRPDAMWFGAKRMYDRHGFKEVARRKQTRPVVRKELRPPPRQNRRT